MTRLDHSARVSPAMLAILALGLLSELAMFALIVFALTTDPELFRLEVFHLWMFAILLALLNIRITIVGVRWWRGGAR